MLRLAVEVVRGTITGFCESKYEELARIVSRFCQQKPIAALADLLEGFEEGLVIDSIAFPQEFEALCFVDKTVAHPRVVMRSEIAEYHICGRVFLERFRVSLVGYNRNTNRLQLDAFFCLFFCDIDGI